jgi:hypothetical protein
MKPLIFVIPLAPVLSGCTHYFVHPSRRTTAEFNRDKRECENVAGRESARKGTKPCDEVERCLIGKGWRRG